MNPLILLGLAIVTEIIGTTALKASEGFSRLWPSLVVVVAYIMAFTFMSFSLKELPLGLVYAIWSGVGTAGTVIIGVLVWKEQLTLWHLLGTGLIIAGVVVLNFFTNAHA